MWDGNWLYLDLIDLKKMLREDNLSIYLRVMVIDREKALIFASQNIFPQVGHILYHWHIGKNVFKTCTKYFLVTNKV